MSKILIVDDNPTNLKLVTFLVKSFGYQVETAIDADSTLAAVHASHPDAILMDIQLPGIDGLELTRRIKAEPSTRSVAVIALTAYAMKGDREKAFAAGCDDYMTKPIDASRLRDVIARHVGGVS